MKFKQRENMKYFKSIQYSKTQSLEMSIFCDVNSYMNLINKPNIFVSNDSSNWFLYNYINSSYMYLADLMANYIKIESYQPITFHYNANLKK